MDASLNKKIDEAGQRFLRRVEVLRSEYRAEIKRITQTIEKKKLDTLRKSLDKIS